LIFPVGNFETFLSTPEIIYALEHGHIKKVLAINIYEKANIFSEYVEYFYNMRLEAKAKGDEVRTLLYKLFLNSLYGKFGQKSNHWEKVGEADPTEVKLERIYDVDTKKFITVKIFGGGIFRKNDLEEGENESFYSFPAIASHVTSYARMLLWKYIETAGIENVYYTDTDSLFVNLEGYKNLEKANYLNEDTLGLLKLEYQSRLLRNPRVQGLHFKI
jgi:DNA polymerase elongation subunit (family B)